MFELVTPHLIRSKRNSVENVVSGITEQMSPLSSVNPTLVVKANVTYVV